MAQNANSLRNSRRHRQPPPYVPLNPFRPLPDPTTASATPGRSPAATQQANTESATTTRRPDRGGGTSRVTVTPPSAVPQHALRPSVSAVAEVDFAMSSGGAGAATYTGAAILNTYTNRRKILQKASALSSQMHRQVEDVVQMEEEQRLLSQAYRSRQKLAEQEQEQAQHQSKQKKLQTARGDLNSSPDQHLLSPLSEDTEELPSTAIHGDADAPANHAAAPADGYGVVLEGAPDTKRLLQHQAHEKNETLGKMRGMQVAIQELSAEAAAEEERWYARPRFVGDSPVEVNNANGADGEGEDAPPPPRAVPPDVIGKLDAIRDLRLALKDMLDARRGHAADSGSYGSIGTGASGSTWVEQDAQYNPPPPPQVFSTSALAVSLEYVSDSMASIARIADEFCVATTFRARNDRLMLLPHLSSLEKWTAQAHRSLETTQRHLRHFHVGEAAVLEGGAYEVNSLREQTLLLKETLTAQDQKVKSTAETKAAMLHRLREITRRCRMWESYLLHRGAEGDAGNRLLQSPVFYSLGNAPTAHSTASMSMRSTDYTTTVSAGETYTTSAASPPSAFLIAATGSTREGSTRTALKSARQSSVDTADASPPPRAPTAILKDFLLLSPSPVQHQLAASSAVRGHGQASGYDQPPSPSAMDRMERRIAQSWGNPYVRKRLLRQRAEAAAQEQQQQQQQQQTSYSSLPLLNYQAVNGRAAVAHSLPTVKENLRAASKGDRSTASGAGGSAADADESCLASTSPTAPLPRHSLRPGGPSTVSTSFNAFGSSSHKFPRASQGEGKRRSKVSISPPAPPSSGEGAEAEDRPHGSHALDPRASASSAASGVDEAEMLELADVRALQLLQSLLRSVPLPAVPPKMHPDVLDGTSGNADPLHESPPEVGDVMSDAAAREASRHSMQRLIHFLKAQTAPQNPKMLSASQL